MNAISLFSVLGGMDIGFEEAGFNILGAVEINKYACESLRANRRLARNQNRLITLIYLRNKALASKQRKQADWITDFEAGQSINSRKYLQNCIVFDKDIKKLSPKNILRLSQGQDIDLIYGGSPCQSFSMSGQRKSLDDDRGQRNLFNNRRLMVDYCDINPK